MFRFWKRNKGNVELVCAERENFITTLSKIFQLLLKSKNDRQAKYVLYLIDLLNQNDFSGFIKAIQTVDMWGGSGAVWEVGIKDKNDEINFAREIINLIDLMGKANMLTVRLKRTKEIFQQSLQP